MAEESAVDVEAYDDSDAIADPESYGNFIVTFSDVAVHEHEDLVDRIGDVIRAFPGVERADHEDRELILVWGTDVDLHALEVALRAWWAAEL